SFPALPTDALILSKESHATPWRKGSSLIFHPMDAAGNNPHLLLGPNREDPSYRALIETRYRSRKKYCARPKKEVVALSPMEVLASVGLLATFSVGMRSLA